MRQFVIFTRGIRLCDPDVAGTFVFLIHRVSYWNFLPLTTTLPVFSIDATRIYVSVVRRTRRKRARIREDMLLSPRPFRFACPVSTNPKRGRVTCSRDNRTVKRAFLTELAANACRGWYEHETYENARSRSPFYLSLCRRQNIYTYSDTTSTVHAPIIDSRCQIQSSVYSTNDFSKI